MARSNSNDTASKDLLSRRRLLMRMGMIAGAATAAYTAPAMIGFDAARASGNSGGGSGGGRGGSGGGRGGNSGNSGGRGRGGNSGNSRGNSRGSSRGGNFGRSGPSHSRGRRNTGRAHSEAGRLMRQIFGG